MTKPPPIKLLLITTVPETLGFFTGQVGYMKQRGLEIHALSSPGELLAQFAEREQVPVYAVTMPRRITPLGDLIAIFHLWRHIRQIHPHIVHASTPKAGLLGTISAWLAGVPVRIYLNRGLPLMTASGLKRSLLWWSEKVSCLLSHQTYCVSHSIAEVMVAEKICSASKVKVLLGGSSNGVSALGRFNPAHCPKKREDVRQQYGIPQDALVIGFVGRIIRDKGVGELVSAWKILRDEFPNLHLLVVGPFESQDPIDPEAEACLRSDPRIHLTGRQAEMAPVYTAMDVVTLPTYREGLPNVPLEAAAMQLPVVATKVPGCIEAVQDGVTGTLVPLYDVECLTVALRTYLQNPDLRQQHGQAGRDRVLREFNQEVLWESWYQEYQHLLQAKGLPISEPLTAPKAAMT